MRATIIAIKRGSNGRTTFTIVVLATPTPTNNTVPTGGVQSPIDKFRIMIIPKCTGSIPSSTTIGRNIGVKMSTAGVISIKTPTKRSIKLISSKMTILLSLKARIDSVTF